VPFFSATSAAAILNFKMAAIFDIFCSFITPVTAYFYGGFGLIIS
jgi:hypothetical protein